MTIRELIAELRKYDADMEVVYVARHLIEWVEPIAGVAVRVSESGTRMVCLTQNSKKLYELDLDDV